MSRRTLRLGIGILVIAAALTLLIYEGLHDTMVYFVTPAELTAKGQEAYAKAWRLGGLVVPGSLKRGPEPLALSFRVTDGSATVPVTFKGVPPDLFREGTGVVLEGKYTPEGIFRATLIMAKHSEEYRPPERFEKAAAQKLYRTLSRDPARAPETR